MRVIFEERYVRLGCGASIYQYESDVKAALNYDDIRIFETVQEARSFIKEQGYAYDYTMPSVWRS